MRSSLILMAVATPCYGQVAEKLRTNAPIPSPMVAYADVMAMVKAGGDIRVAFGVAAPAGYVRVDMDSPGASAVPFGLWRCWRLGKEPKMERTDVASPPVLSGSLGQHHWTWPGDLTDHLVKEHGQDATALARMTPEQRATTHDRLHTGVSLAPVTQSAYQQPVVQTNPLPYAPLPNLQYYLRPGGVGGSSCPGGNCPYR